MQPRNMSMSGVVDLAAVKAAGEAKAKAEQARAQAARQGGTGAVPPSALVIDVDEAGFERDIVQRSAEVPVVIDFWAEWCQPCKQLTPLLERLVTEYNGRLVLAKIDVEANQMLAQQFGIQSIPAVYAVVAGQALPLFQGAAPEPQVRETLDQLVQVAEQRFGLTGLTVDAEGQAPAAAGAAPAGPYDALLEAAVRALDSNDIPGAVQAYKNVLVDDPENAEAKLGLAQAELLGRVQGMDPQAVRKNAADNPKDVPAQLAAADLDLVGGHVADAFARLVDTVRLTAGDDRNAARVRLLELFEVIGPDDPRVVKARGDLARVLF